jgi:hypothetical protein
LSSRIKQLLRVGKYLAGPDRFDSLALKAVLTSALVILTTIHAQDFADVEGDKLMNRRTVCIVAPNLSRIATFAILPFWSIVLGTVWKLEVVPASMFFVLGLYCGSRYYSYRSVSADQRSYLFYNVSHSGFSLLHR